MYSALKSSANQTALKTLLDKKTWRGKLYFHISYPRAPLGDVSIDFVISSVGYVLGLPFCLFTQSDSTTLMLSLILVLS